MESKFIRKTRAGLIIDDTDVSYLNYDLCFRSQDSDFYSIDFLIVQKTFLTEKGRLHNFISYAKRKGIKRLLGRVAFAII